MEQKEKNIQTQKKKLLRNYVLLSAILCFAVGCPIVTRYDLTEIQFYLLGAVLVTISNLYYIPKNHKLNNKLKQCCNNNTSKDTSTDK